MTNPNPTTGADDTTRSVCHETLARLQEQTGDDDGELLQELVEVFVEDLGESCPQLESLVEAAQLDALGREAHRLKSGAANLGALLLTQHCKDLESAANAGQQERSAELVKALIAEVPRVAEGLQLYLSKMQ